MPLLFGIFNTQVAEQAALVMTLRETCSQRAAPRSSLRFRKGGTFDRQDTPSCHYTENHLPRLSATDQIAEPLASSVPINGSTQCLNKALGHDSGLFGTRVEVRERLAFRAIGNLTAQPARKRVFLRRRLSHPMATGHACRASPGPKANIRCLCDS